MQSLKCFRPSKEFSSTRALTLQVAAEFITRRVAGVRVTPHYCPIQDKDAGWYRQFQVIVLGLDSIEVRHTSPSMPSHDAISVELDVRRRRVDGSTRWHARS